VSAEATAWVFRHSPYEHGAFAVHLALGDAANDLWDNQLWFGLEKLAAKARVRRSTAQGAVATMVKDGYLETVKARGGPGTTAVHRFVFVENAPIVFRQESTGPKTGRPKSGRVGSEQVQKTEQQVQNPESVPLIEPKEPKGSSRPRSRSTQIPDDFAVSDDMRRWASDKGIRSNLGEETEKFVDYYRSKGDCRIDWVAAWRNWLRNADKFAVARPDPTQSKSAAARARVRAQLEPNRLELP